jgi:hypothetical protein
MEYLSHIYPKLSIFASPLSLNYDLKYNSQIFDFSDKNNISTLDMFLQQFFIQHVEKITQSHEEKNNITIYYCILISILKNLQSHFNGKEIQKNKLTKFKEHFMMPFDNKDSINNNNKTIKFDVIIKDLKLEMETYAGDLFFEDEIDLLPITIIKSIAEADDLTNPNIFIRSINLFDNDDDKEGYTLDILCKNGYCLITDTSELERFYPKSSTSGEINFQIFNDVIIITNIFTFI